MCEGCCDPAKLTELLEAERRLEPLLTDGPSTIRVIQAADVSLPEGQRTVLLVTGAPAGSGERRSDADAVRTRDAIVQLGKALFESRQPANIAIRWDPTTTPVVLDAANAFASGHGPSVFVYLDRAQQHSSEWSIVQLLDWKSGLICLSANPLEDLWRNHHHALAGVVFVGGGAEAAHDRQSLQNQMSLSNAPKFAVRSTGGTAGRLQDRELDGGLDPAKLNAAGSYLVLMNEIVARMFP